MSLAFAHELPFGAQPQAHGRTRFRLWAPAESAVALQLEDGRCLPLRAQPGGWFEGEFDDCGQGTAYRYRLSDGTLIADPAARAQRDDVQGPSLVVEPLRHLWRNGGWRGRPWSETVIYELHVGACGGYAGVLAQLPRLAALGITAIELMPLAQCPGERNWGYDGVLLYAPMRAYGSSTELKILIDTAHGLGLMVFLDVVYNHFGPQGNVLHRIAPAFFREDRRTPWGAAIDYRREEVREFIAHNALYWLHEYRFDGLRLDAVHAMADDGFLPQLASRLQRSVLPQRQVHLMLENERNDLALLRPVEAQRGHYQAQWSDDAHNALHVLLTGEREGYYADFAEQPAAQLARCLYAGCCRPPQQQALLSAQAFVFFLQNHDQVGNRALGERLQSLCGEATLHAAIALQLLTPMVPLLFMGEEWGSRRRFLYFTDYQGELAQAVRDGRRREFARFAAFSDPQQRQRIPDPNALRTFLDSCPDFAACEDEDGRYWQALYARLLQLRREHLLPRLSSVQALDALAFGAAAVCARWSLGEGRVLQLAANFDQYPAALPVAYDCRSDKLLYDSAPALAQPVALLPAFCTRAWLL
ncbi:maltooligosyl trehalose hydrolase [Solimonas aquatica]|uniref:Malto-oligosyltrehalose trehalohydrolase n=1 Tax=Solimonas aquatica TaxID=489703 RepID=A0A1H9ADZ6_9GAMM|nr:malto-oligosyltrehalose trehalohydrolase [Solimonas aquatica]SEP74944.1 maltooligosyl trehalose hydrolase [Solimonas aquatica]